MRDMKDSGIEWYGNIPREWRIAPIKRQFAIVAGATPKSDKSEYWDGGIPWMWLSALISTTPDVVIGSLYWTVYRVY